MLISLLLLLPLNSSAAFAALNSVQTPLRVFARNPSDSSRGIGVPISIAGGPSQNLLFDTGSTGIRVFSESVGSFGFARTGEPKKVVFVDGVVFDGEIALASVQVGSVSGVSPIRIHVVDRVYCASDRPDCPVSKLGKKKYTDMGIHGIAGFRIRDLDNSSATALQNPLSAMPGNLSGGYRIHLEGVRSSRGVLTLGITREVARGFRFVDLPLSAGSWDDTSVRACYTVLSSPIQQVCYPSLFDTGATAAFLFAENFPADRLNSRDVLKDGNTLKVEFPPYFQYEVRVGAKADSLSVDDVVINNRKRTNFKPGMGFFYSYDVIFDRANGRIGFRKNR